MRHWKRYALMVVTLASVAGCELYMYIESYRIKLDDFWQINLTLLFLVSLITLLFSLMILAVEWGGL